MSISRGMDKDMQYIYIYIYVYTNTYYILYISSVQSSSVPQSCLTFCDPNVIYINIIYICVCVCVNQPWKKQNNTICSNTDESGVCHTERSKSDREKYMKLLICGI